MNERVPQRRRRVLLMGNPNVGKSVVFSRLTGANVIASNYPGTTVEYTKGFMRMGDEQVEVVDVPGTYSLEPTSRAEEVALEMLREAHTAGECPDIVINVVDATNLERNLNLTLQLLKAGVPMVVALNMWDEAKHVGVSINVEELEQILGVPVVPTVAITGEGIRSLVQRLPEARGGTWEFDEEDRWAEVGKVVRKVQEVEHRHHTWLEKLSDASLQPFSGTIMGAVVLYLSFRVIRFVGEGLATRLMEPLFERYWGSLMMRLSHLLGSGGVLHDILVGRLVEGRIDFLQSLGLLTTGLFVDFAVVFPYVVAVYLVLSIGEDSGYVPRLSVLLDGIMHRLGLHGLAIVPMLLGCGCNVPGVMATRILETRRERFIAATLMAIAVPCASQTAVIIGLVGSYGASALLMVFGTLLAVGIVLGVVMNLLLKGESPEIFVEIPPYRFPYVPGLLRKLLLRLRWFLQEAVPFVLLGVLIVNLLYRFGIIGVVGSIAAPVVTGLLGLPKEAVGAMIVGFLRKDVAVGMLAPLQMSMRQLVIASVVLTMYFPCMATFVVMLKELGIKDMLRATAIMLVVTLAVGTLLNLTLA
ncbi:MAG: ferrous iron transporter B [bacterium]|nr:ferrous iron transporter B [candidate division KSB1 bacterium]MDH7559005.1 ferrous iron transporter B [bacterium]